MVRRHYPHEAAHVRDLMKEIAVIVLGLVVAVAAGYGSYLYKRWMIETSVERVMKQTQGVRP